MAEKKRTGPVAESSKEAPQPRSARDPRLADIKPNPDRDVAGDQEQVQQVREISPGS